MASDRKNVVHTVKGKAVGNAGSFVSTVILFGSALELEVKAHHLLPMPVNVARYVDPYRSLTDYLGTRPVQPIADIVQCGLDNRKLLRSNRLDDCTGR